MADETITTGEAQSLMAHMREKVQRSQETWPDDWRYRFSFYDGEVANLLDEMQQPAQADEPRAIIQAFAATLPPIMERKLAEHDDNRTGWLDDYSARDLWDYAEIEMAEVYDALKSWRQAKPDSEAEDKARGEIVAEVADVCNYLMMLCQLIGALPPTDERGK